MVKKAFWIFSLLTVFTVIADRLLFVLFPVYLIQNNFSATSIGIIFSVSALALAVFRTSIGRFSDRYGRKLIMSIGLLVDGIAIALYPVVSRLYEFAIVRSVKEIGWTLQESLNDALQADSFPKKIRPRYLVKLGIIFPASRTLAAIIGIIVVTYFTLTLGFYIASFFMFLAFLLFAFFYSDKITRKNKEKLNFNPFRYTSKVNIMAIIVFLQALSFTFAYQPAFFILAEKHLAIHADMLFTILLVAYVLASLLVYLISRRIYSFGSVKILTASFFAFSILIPVYAFARDLFIFAIPAISVAVIFYIFRLSFKTIIMDITKPKLRGEQMGFIKTVEGIGVVIGPIIGGLLIDTIGIQAPFLLAGPVNLIAAIILCLKRF